MPSTTIRAVEIAGEPTSRSFSADLVWLRAEALLPYRLTFAPIAVFGRAPRMSENDPRTHSSIPRTGRGSRGTRPNILSLELRDRRQCRIQIPCTSAIDHPGSCIGLAFEHLPSRAPQETLQAGQPGVGSPIMEFRLSNIAFCHPTSNPQPMTSTQKDPKDCLRGGAPDYYKI